jgi:glutaredoxin 3
MNRIRIYTTRYCSYCIAAKRLLLRKGVDFTEIDVSADAKGRSKMAARANGCMTVPQIFIGSIFVGGYDDLYLLDQRGKLDALLVGDDAAAHVDQEPHA